jgi:stearoyl-CoA desaturase (delta-9 desaturase)
MSDRSSLLNLPILNGSKAATIFVTLTPFLGLIAAAVFWWGWGLTWIDVALFTGMYLVTGIGITVGYHRLFTHRSFETVRPIKFALAVLGAMSVQGPVIKWAAVHRRHHHHSDGEDDPHSPHGFGGGVLGVLAGFWHAHMGWMFKGDVPELGRYIADLHADRLIRATDRLFVVWAVLGLAIPAALGGLIAGSWRGAAYGFLWGGLVRVFFVNHATFSINSICHLWGTRPFKSRDHSRNNFLFGWLGLGEGWHNNHHAFPVSARHGLRWWEFDLSYIVIRALSAVGLAWRVNVPGAEALAAKRIAAT